VALVWAAAIVRESRDEHARRLDVPGLLLASVLLLATTYAFIEGGRAGATAPQVLTAAVVAVLAVPALIVAELRRGDDAMLPVALLRRPVFDAANGVAGIMNLGTLGTLFVLMLFLQSVQGRSALLGGAAVIPLFAPLAVVAPFGGRITSRIGARLPAVAGLVMGAAGLALLVLAGPHSPYPVLLPAFLLWGAGMGLLTPAVVAAAIGSVPAERAGLASATNNTARQTGGAIGIAVAGAVAGEPGDGARFVRGFHAVALGAAGLYAVGAVLALVILPGVLFPGGER
jgi:DHA2 family methylenomycin A resistance protein-like MFS transporter